MRASKKYKGKSTKKRLNNVVRGTALWGFRQSSGCLWYYERLVAYKWYTEGKITFKQFQQWGY